MDERRKGADTPYQLVFFHGLTEPAAAPPGSRLIPLIFNEVDADLAVSTLAANDLASADSKTTAIRYLELLLIDEEKIKRGLTRQTLNNVNTLIANHQVFNNCLAELLRDTLGDNPRVWELAARLEDGWQRTLGELLETVQAINED